LIQAARSDMVASREARSPHINKTTYYPARQRRTIGQESMSA
jgi:hypothetical protein